jgi:GH25 family lysozyme M1 (1,4-beta-N-acetylmuramidase)
MNAVEWVDVSYVQGYPNYLQLKSDGIYGAIARVNEGTIEDGSLAWNWPRISAAGLVRGGYDFAYTANTAAFEAAQFLAYLQAVGGWTANDILVLDIEQNAGNLSAGALQQWVLAWCSTVMSATGIRPWIYSYLSFISQYLQNSALTAYPLWVAEPSATSWPAAPAPWSAIVAWQYGEGALNGVSGNVDLDEVATVAPPPAKLYSVSYILEDTANGKQYIMPEGTWIDPAQSQVFTTAQVPMIPLADAECTDLLANSNAAVLSAINAFATNLQVALSNLATPAEVAQVDADVKAAEAQEQGDVAVVEEDIKALPEPATPGEVLALDSRVASVEADVLEGDAAIENVINNRVKAKP